MISSLKYKCPPPRIPYRPFQMRVWSCITSYALRGLPYLAYDNVNPAIVNSMMLRSSMLTFRKVYAWDVVYLEVGAPGTISTNDALEKKLNFGRPIEILLMSLEKLKGTLEKCIN